MSEYTLDDVVTRLDQLIQLLTNPTAPLAHASPPAQPRANTVALGEAIGRYVDEKRRTGQWLDEVAKTQRRTLDGFVSYFDGPDEGQVLRDVGDPTRQDVSIFRTYLQGRRWRGQPVSVNTVNHQLGYLASFFRWCVVQGLRPDNPAEGMRIKGRKVAMDARLPLDAVDLALILPRVLAETGARRWLPLIMLYTGARNEEVAQLRIGDVRPVNGVWCFDFASLDEGQRRKTEASRRLVPIHPRLVEYGLDEYMGPASVPSSDAFFPELTRSHKGTLSDQPSRWFNRQLRDAGVTDRRKVLYSLRHTVATQLKVEHGVEESLIAQLLGHANGSMTTGRYGKRFPVQKLAEVVELLRY